MKEIGYIEDLSHEKSLLKLFCENRGKKIKLPIIKKRGGSQYNARIFGLRKKIRKNGEDIINIIERKTGWFGRKVIHSFYIFGTFEELENFRKEQENEKENLSTLP